jgi:hypothetical protein
MSSDASVGAVIDPALCPICGQPNHCRLVAGAHSNEECWCFRVRFPPSLLARVPEHARRRACICQRCFSEALGSESSLLGIVRAHGAVNGRDGGECGSQR